MADSSKIAAGAQASAPEESKNDLKEPDLTSSDSLTPESAPSKGNTIPGTSDKPWPLPGNGTETQEDGSFPEEGDDEEIPAELQGEEILGEGGPMGVMPCLIPLQPGRTPREDDSSCDEEPNQAGLGAGNVNDGSRPAWIMFGTLLCIIIIYFFFKR